MKLTLSAKPIDLSDCKRWAFVHKPPVVFYLRELWALPLPAFMIKTKDATTYLSAQDTTNHPAWTGEKKSIVGEDSRAAHFLRKFENLRKPGDQQK